MKKDWKDFFNGFSLFRTSLIQENYINTIKKFTPKDGKILEIASGSGLSSVLMADLGYEVTCTDIDDDLLKTIREKFHSIKNLKIENCNMFEADKQYSKEFNSIIHQGVLEHFEDEEIIEILNRQKNIADFIIFDVPNDKRVEKIQEYGNERFLSIEHWTNLIKAAGCSLIYIEGRRFEDFIEKTKHSLTHEERIKYGTSNTFVIKSNELISKKLHYGCGTVYLKDWFNIDAGIDFMAGDRLAKNYLEDNITTREEYYKYNFDSIVRNEKKIIADLEANSEVLSGIFNKYFSEVIMFHVLEHIPKYKIDEFIKQLKSITTEDAIFQFAVPDNLGISKLYIDSKNEEERQKYHSWIFGKQRNQYCHHFTGYDIESFRNFLKNHFNEIEFCKNENNYPAIWVKCKK